MQSIPNSYWNATKGYIYKALGTDLSAKKELSQIRYAYLKGAPLNWEPVCWEPGQCEPPQYKRFNRQV